MGMKLGELLEAIRVTEFNGDPGQEIEGLAYDSRRVRPGFLFVAIRGHKGDGHDYIPDAIHRGAKAILAEHLERTYVNISWVRVLNSRAALSKLAVHFYNRPFEGIKLIGITGTNGKTTTSYLIESILTAAGAVPGVIGTINYRFKGQARRAPVTTPESADLMALFREMAQGGATHVILEVSSHALDQNRTVDCPFSTAVFTNISRDHLDYHLTMENYFRAKSLLFQNLSAEPSGHGATAVINMDDPKGKALAALTRARIVSYGLGRDQDVRAVQIHNDLSGLRLKLLTPAGSREIRSPLMGETNLYNILAASAAAFSLGIDLHKVAEGIQSLTGVPGRMERVKNNRRLKVVVDYAHTPDALLKILQTLKPLVENRLITVFGCGGDRDKGKRYDMGFAAGEYSDLAIITSDNPRSENPLDIILEIERGMRASGAKKENQEKEDLPKGPRYLIQEDRRKAIRMAMATAGERDLVLIAGKGHEDYQIIGAETRHFDDREEAALAAS